MYMRRIFNTRVYLTWESRAKVAFLASVVTYRFESTFIGCEIPLLYVIATEHLSSWSTRISCLM